MTGSTVGAFNDGAGYERLMGRWSRLAGRDFLDWCNVPQGKTWLDVGCGNGAFTEEILARCGPATVDGIDPSPEQVGYAETRKTSVDYLVGDALALPYSDARFDVSAMALVIAFVAYPAKAVAEMKRVTKPGGLVATYMWDLPAGGVHLAPFYRALKDMGLPGPMPPHAQVSKRDALSELWRAAGLEAVETKVIHINVHFTDFEDFWASNTVPIGPQAERLKTMGTSQIEDLRQRLKRSVPFAADGSITYGAFANAVKGRA